MRGLGNVFKGVLLIVGLAGASTGFAQKQGLDPRVWVYFDNVATCPAGFTPQIGFKLVNGKPVVGTDGFYEQTTTCVITSSGQPVTDPAPVLLNAVSLTRTINATTFTGRAGYDLGIWNNNTNSLSRLYFSINVSNPAGAPGDNGKIEKLVNGTGFSCYQTSKPGTILSEPYNVSDLTCTSNLSLPEKFGTTVSSRAVTIVVKTPTSGDPLKVTASAGGYEGGSNTGQGCCAIPARPASTVLIDSVASGEYTFNTTTFLTSDELGFVFTGNGKADRRDPFATNITVPTNWASGAKYDRASISERSFPEDGARCKQSKLRRCQETTVSLPNVSYAPPAAAEDVCKVETPLLEIVLTFDSSVVKGINGADPYTVPRIRYDLSETGTGNVGLGDPLVRCGNTLPLTFPCICDATNDGKTITKKIVNTENGRYFAD